MFDIRDLRATVVPKSDQLNAEQLLPGPITIIVTEVRVSDSTEQPVSIFYHGDDGRPYKPCKTMRKVLILGWGQDGSLWSGRSMTIYNDQTVKFGGMLVGGIRISHLSDIQRDIQVSLTATKGKKALHTIKALREERNLQGKTSGGNPGAFDVAKATSEVIRALRNKDAHSAAEYVSILPETDKDATLAALQDADYNAVIAAWPQVGKN